MLQDQVAIASLHLHAEALEHIQDMRRARDCGVGAAALAIELRRGRVATAIRIAEKLVLNIGVSQG
jgi:hypothetical protein